MSLEDLQEDLAMNLAEVEKLDNPLVTAGEVAKHLRSVLWPFMKNVISEMEEMDGSIEDLYRNAEDILQPETAGRLAAVLVTATGLITRELVPRLNKDNLADRKVLTAISAWVKLAKEAGDEIEQITIQPAEGEDPEPDDPDEDDDEEDDEGEDGGAEGGDEDEDDDEEDE